MENLWCSFINHPANALNCAEVIRTVAIVGTEISSIIENPHNEVYFLMHTKVNGMSTTIVYDGDKYSCIHCGWAEKLGWRCGEPPVELSEPDFDLGLEDKKLIDNSIVDYINQ